MVVMDEKTSSRFKIVTPLKAARATPPEVQAYLTAILNAPPGKWTGDGMKYPTQKNAQSMASSWKDRIAKANGDQKGRYSTCTWKGQDGFFYIGIRRLSVGETNAHSIGQIRRNMVT